MTCDECEGDETYEEAHLSKTVILGDEEINALRKGFPLIVRIDRGKQLPIKISFFSDKGTEVGKLRSAFKDLIKDVTGKKKKPKKKKRKI